MISDGHWPFTPIGIFCCIKLDDMATYQKDLISI